ncbi:MAG: GNAT family N-acetyltransferase [Paracoccaceae bacterium]
MLAHPFHAVLAHPGTTVFGAEGAGDLLGMVTLHLLPNVTWHGRSYGVIENVFTHQNHRKRGVGRSIMQMALDHAWKETAYKVMLKAGQQRGARGFYQALGFTDVDKFAMVLRQD